MYGYVYKTTNLRNGKIYIGQHKSSVYDAEYLGSGKLINRAIIKYGKDNFTNCVLIWCNSRNELNKMERHFIKMYDSQNPKNGYNIAHGGEGGDVLSCLSEDKRRALSKNKSRIMTDNHRKYPEKYHQASIKGWQTRRQNGNDVMSDEQRQKLSESHKGHVVLDETRRKIAKANSGKNHPMYGTHRSDETKLKISRATKGRVISKEARAKMSASMLGENNPFFGKTHSEEIKARISASSSERFKNRIWMNNGAINKRVPSTDINDYKKLGFIEGRLKW